MFVFDERLLNDLFGNIEMEPTTIRVLVHIMDRVSDVLSNNGSYEDLINNIISSEGQCIKVLIGVPGEVNIIPANEPAKCRQILLAFAHGRRSPKTGLLAVMRQVREHLIRCGDSTCRNIEPTRVAIIFTDLWDKDIFAESVADLLAHHESPPGKVIFGALVNKGRITLQTII